MKGSISTPAALAETMLSSGRRYQAEERDA
jgi:hypothetical protein